VANKGSFLKPGEFLSTETGDYLVSADSSHFAAIQGDGNFCIYRGSGPGDNVHGPALWCSMKLAPAPCFVAMQSDGNVCVYRGRDPGDNVYGPALWCSMSNGPEPRFAVLGNDGRLWVYLGSGPRDNQGAVWCNNPPRWKVPICGTSGGIRDQILQEVEVAAFSREAAEASQAVVVTLNVLPHYR
jgi:hypothetical protein